MASSEGTPDSFWLNHTPPKTPRFSISSARYMAHSEVSTPSKSSSTMDDRLSDLASEIKYLIFDSLDSSSATSFSLACPAFYGILKERYPNLIRLSQAAFVSRIPKSPYFRTSHDIYIDGETMFCSDFPTDQINLGELIQNWRGFKSYRLHASFPVLYLNKSIYGHAGRTEEEQWLENRYKTWELGKKREVSDGVSLELPSPRNTGLDWLYGVWQWIAATRHNFNTNDLFWDSWEVRGTVLDELDVWTTVKRAFEVDMDDVWKMVMWEKAEKELQAELVEIWGGVMGWKRPPKEEKDTDVDVWSVGSFEERKEALDPDRVWSERLPFAAIGSLR